MRLTAEVVEAFAGTFLSHHYDDTAPTPEFHRKIWRLYCEPVRQAASAAPRGHAKSTGLTLAYGLAVVLFRDQDYEIVLGASEEMAIEHLGEMAYELRENEDLCREFSIKHFVQEQKSDIIVECYDGHQFRLIARGAEQKIRGRKWHGKRPGLILFDDIEDDEQVENKERRKKFRYWFFRAAKQALRDRGIIRGHGTILHDDSLLARLMRNRTWKTIRFQAHRSFDDFSDILWPEKFSEERLREIQQEFVDEGDAAGYSQEFLNDPQDNADAYLRKDDFIAMSEEDYAVDKIVCAAADFAIKKDDLANRTSFTIGGKCLQNRLHFLDQRADRWDSLEIIEEMFSVQARWNPDVFWVEDGVIWKALAPMVYREMQLTGVFINIEPINPVKDKSVRGRSLQRRSRAGGCRFDKNATWYPGFELELLKFTGSAQAILDDQFDSASLLSKGFDTFVHLEEEDFYSEEDWALEHGGRQVRQVGRSSVTGY